MIAQNYEVCHTTTQPQLCAKNTLTTWWYNTGTTVFGSAQKGSLDNTLFRTSLRVLDALLAERTGISHSRQ
jgi:hypothetical protein